MSRPGGKGLNVARTLTALGADVLVTGLIGDRTGEAVRSGLDGAGVRAAFTAIAGETRRTFAVVDAGRGRTALFNEPGPDVSAAEYARFLGRYAAEAAGSAAVVLSGSLPRGLRQDAYAELAAIAAAGHVPVVLDTSGQALRDGVAAGPAIVKPNAGELAAAVGRPLPSLDSEPPGTSLDADPTGTGLDAGRPSLDAGRPVPGLDAGRTGTGEALASVVSAAGELRAAGARAVVVSLGAAGLLAVTGAGVWWARQQPRRVASNPTGAGDAVVAGLTLGLVAGQPWGERLRRAVALGSAAAAARVAGEFGRDEYERAMTETTVTRLEVAGDDRDHGHPAGGGGR
jgi:tagatose 6-phosphate kinase